MSDEKHLVAVLVVEENSPFYHFLTGRGTGPGGAHLGGNPRRDTSKKAPRIVNTSVPAERVDPLMVSKALGADSCLDRRCVAGWIMSQNSHLHLEFQPDVVLLPQKDKFLEFAVGEKICAFFGEKRILRVYVKETNETLWPQPLKTA